MGYDDDREKTKRRLAAILQRPTDRVFVACEPGGGVVGYLHGSDYECTYSNSMKTIVALVVDEAFRGAGAGRKTQFNFVKLFDN